MYQLIKNPFTNIEDSVRRLSDNACIPFTPANTDYDYFKKDLANGIALQDATDNAMTAEQITTFLSTLP